MTSISEYRFHSTAFEEWASPLRDAVESGAQALLSTRDAKIKTLTEAMAYAVTGGGKRVRALLAYATGNLCGAARPDLDKVALAVEFVHAYSLVHDDLPCMDNDTLRRGKPTCHVKYGVAEAMLAGDALQPEAFLLLTQLGVSEKARLAVLTVFAQACGRNGMCGGQAIDLEHVGKPLKLELLQEMHKKKTGALIDAAIRMGALCGKPEIYDALEEQLRVYSHSLGLGFQVVDDILDVTSDAATLGKTVGKDAVNSKPTYVSLLGLEASRRLALACMEQALGALKAIEDRSLVQREALERLADLAHYMIGRTK